MTKQTEFRLLMSPLTRTIYAGRAKDLGGGTALSTGVRYDVTNDFLGVLIQYAESHGGVFEIVGGGEVHDVTITKRSDKSKTSNHDLFKTSDANKPSQICDRNGEVVLGLCKRCGKAEAELSEPCVQPTAGR